ncbi:ABC transporter permease subunit [Nocardioides sp. MAH-18]|uniref:ABC transporter permease subunit n=1 Tax=Nocardioides agri TaxID=2682843 RepID=A0A6L6XT97_9ACTN|nr:MULTISPECIES: ABC transporter permease [unclassified Nocardioides]MBA2954842.1 ABC transporter permease subunit [Nocardioides sp. CGMCC 1.13656]MVQ49696.1 ABC transporter permease subunit [Nocardioides sp. MAH-18]
MTAVAVETEVGRTTRPTPARIPMSRIIGVELRKSFDTRSGFWLLASVGILAVLATAATILFAPDDAITYDSFGAAIGIPMAIILPMIAILSVTSEWSQRTGLTSFTLVPHRGRIIRAKLTVALGVGIVSMLLAFGIGALGNLLGAAIVGVDPVWDIVGGDFAGLILFQILNMLIGFMLGVLFRNSAGAIVGYFVYGFVLGTITSVLAATQEWFEKAQPWVDFNYAQGALTDASSMTGENWAQLAVTGLFWLVIPLAIGLWSVLRSEVK